MKKHFNNKLKEEIISKINLGQGVYSLAKEYKVGASTIYKWLRLRNNPNNTTNKLIDLKGLIIDDIISFNINGLDIKIDSINLNKLFKGLKK